MVTRRDMKLYIFVDITANKYEKGENIPDFMNLGRFDVASFSRHIKAVNPFCNKNVL